MVSRLRVFSSLNITSNVRVPTFLVLRQEISYNLDTAEEMITLYDFCMWLIYRILYVAICIVRMYLSREFLEERGRKSLE